MQNSLSAINEALENDPTKDLIAFLREESQQQQCDDRFMTLMECMLSQVPASYAWKCLEHDAYTTINTTTSSLTNQTMHYDNMFYQNL